MTTYNNIINSFKEFSENHKQINTFFSGQDWNFQTQNNIYPAVLIIPDASSIEQGRFLYKFNIFVIDILKSDLSNQDEIYSDMAQIAGDIVSEFEDNEDSYGFTLEDNVTINPVYEQLDDFVGGWIMNISIQVPFNMSDCLLPLN